MPQAHWGDNESYERYNSLWKVRIVRGTNSPRYKKSCNPPNPGVEAGGREVVTVV